MITYDEMKKEVYLWADRIKVKPVQVHIRQMKNKWASCSSRGRITLNKDIAKESRKLLKQVIVHELLHLKYPNHGRMFKALLKAYLGSQLMKGENNHTLSPQTSRWEREPCPFKKGVKMNPSERA